MRRLVSAIMLALVAGSLTVMGAPASAAPGAGFAAPASPGSFGVRLADVPVSEADNPRALSYIIDYLPTGTVIHRRILIVNDEPRTAHFTVYADAAHITSGVFAGYSGATRSELTQWISVQHPRVTLAAGASVTDMVTIKIPQGATRGEHYGVIWVQQAARARAGHGLGITEVNRVGVRLYLAVGRGGAPPTSFDIVSVTGLWVGAGRPEVVVHADNTGGRAVDLEGSVTLTNGPGDTRSGPFRVQRIVTLAPGQSWNLTFPLPAGLPRGSWLAKTTLVSGLTTATAIAGIHVGPTAAAVAGLSAMEVIWLALGVLVLGVAGAMGQYALRQRRRQAPA